MHIKKILIKILPTFLLCGLSFFIPVASLGKSSPSGNFPSPGVNPNSALAGIQAATQASNMSLSIISKKIDAFFTSLMATNANLMFQFDAYLSEANHIAPQLQPMNSYVKHVSSNMTKADIQAKLIESPYTAMDSSNRSYSTYKKLLNDNLGGATKEDRVKKLAQEPSFDSLGELTLTNSPTANFFNNNTSEKRYSLLTNSLNNYNFNSLIYPSSYSANEQASAEKFITYITKKYNSSGSLDLTPLRGDKDKLKKLQNRPEYQSYLVNNRSMMAALSVPLSNLYYIYLERLNLTDQNNNKNLVAKHFRQMKGVDIKALSANNIHSLLELQNYIADHRANDPKWRKKILSSSPAAVQRETLFVLAEVESQLQRLHSDNERLLAVLSAAQLQMASIGNLNSTHEVQNYITKLNKTD